jgi:hypothetical protein
MEGVEMSETERKIIQPDSIEIFTDALGHVCIGQLERMGGGEAVVSMSPSDIPRICKWLKECAKEGKR